MLGSGQGKTLINVRIFWGKSVVLRNAGLPRKCLFFFWEVLWIVPAEQGLR